MRITDNRQSITGLILAGGQASRMGGEDKGLLLLNGKRLIEHVINRLEPQVKQVQISCNRNIESYQRYGYPLTSDNEHFLGEKTQFNGPLAGVLAGMEKINTQYTLIVPCDCPAFPFDLGQRLLKALIQNNTDAAIPFDGIRTQPLFLLIKTELKDALRSYYLEGGRSMKHWLEGNLLTEVNFTTENSSFINLNTKQELQNFAESTREPPK
jgi:molybdopterin-guanine dinucleotide biosynthesis protein A